VETYHLKFIGNIFLELFGVEEFFLLPKGLKNFINIVFRELILWKRLKMLLCARSPLSKSWSSTLQFLSPKKTSNAIQLYTIKQNFAKETKPESMRYFLYLKIDFSTLQNPYLNAKLDKITQPT
jgi:hypothetical protein